MDESSHYPLLSNINSPADLRKLDLEQLPALCAELRGYLIENLSSNPGHFASSMGAVEIIVALHYVFDSPRDRLVFDVGHQAYVHKILTGRRDAFTAQRTKEGISGFPTPRESEYDTFTTGHAGNSISAALGMSIADTLNPADRDRKTVALIGDASIGCGLAFEGLNNASNVPNNLLIVLNDNDMSIDDNVGALHRALSEMTTSERYNRLRHKLYRYFRSKGKIDDRGRGRLIRLFNSLKAFISSRQNIFEGLNIRYFGPFDGHDVRKIVKTLQDIKNMEGPRLLHLCTVKGKGYAPAEQDPTTWHAPGKFNPDTGQRIKSASGNPKWQDIFGDALVDLARKNPEVVGITAAMPTGTSVARLAEVYPERTFDVGISEGHAVTFAGGLATAGKHPFVAIYSSFLQRAYDNIVNDIAIQGLPVTFCIDRAGLVGEDGVTHHGLLDLAYLRCIPGMKIASPCDADILRDLMLTSLECGGPMAIRYPRGSAPDAPSGRQATVLTPGKGRKLSETPGAKVALLSIGAIATEASKAVRALADEGIPADHYDMIWLKPLDETLLEEVFAKHDLVVTVEDGTVVGGLGTAVSEWLVKDKDKNFSATHAAPITYARLVTLGTPDRWVYQGTPAELKAECGIDAASIAESVRKNLRK